MLFRSFLKPIYKGNQFFCRLCNTHLKHFEKLNNDDLLCPVCGSISRTRRLDFLLDTEFLKPDIKILDFSPSRSLYRKLKNNKSLNYYPTDFENEFLADYHFDITHINTESENFDLIICYHVLEHIVEDQKAISEMYRVLKKGGMALIQTPFKDGDILEDFSIVSKSERLKHFGQEDHVRIYSAEGLAERLKNAGFKTEIKTFPSEEYLGFKEEKILVVKK